MRNAGRKGSGSVRSGALLAALPLLAALAGLAAGSGSLPAGATAGTDGQETCPWCHNDREVLAAAGLAGHGPFVFAGVETTEIDRHLDYTTVVWLETAHHKIGLNLEPYSVPDRESRKVRAELTELKQWMPRIDPKKRYLDRWLRVHLFALRVEKWYARFLEILGRSPEDFPDGKSPYVLGSGATYLGEGPFLGQKGKYEVFLAERLSTYTDFLRKFFGLTTKKPQRWNHLATDALWFGLAGEEENLQRDTAVHCGVVHNLAHNYLDGFKHYSYDIPVWLTEGFGHFAQRSVDPAYVLYDNVEGTQNFKLNGDGWPQEVRRIVARGRGATLADLTRKNTFAEFDQEDHLVIWSKVDFLVATDRAKFASLLERLKGRLDERGISLSRGLADEQREAIRELYGWTYGQLEEAWREWVLATYPPK